MVRPTKVVHMKNSFDAIHLDTDPDPRGLLMTAYEQTVARLMEEWTARGYMPVGDLRITIDVSVKVAPEGAKA